MDPFTYHLLRVIMRGVWEGRPDFSTVKASSTTVSLLMFAFLLAQLAAAWFGFFLVRAIAWRIRDASRTGIRVTPRGDRTWLQCAAHLLMALFALGFMLLWTFVEYFTSCDKCAPIPVPVETGLLVALCYCGPTVGYAMIMSAGTLVAVLFIVYMRPAYKIQSPWSRVSFTAWAVVVACNVFLFGWGLLSVTTRHTGMHNRLGNCVDLTAWRICTSALGPDSCTPDRPWDTLF